MRRIRHVVPEARPPDPERRCIETWRREAASAGSERGAAPRSTPGKGRWPARRAAALLVEIPEVTASPGGRGPCRHERGRKGRAAAVPQDGSPLAELAFRLMPEWDARSLRWRSTESKIGLDGCGRRRQAAGSGRRPPPTAPEIMIADGPAGPRTSRATALPFSGRGRLGARLGTSPGPSGARLVRHAREDRVVDPAGEREGLLGLLKRRFLRVARVSESPRVLRERNRAIHE